MAPGTVNDSARQLQADIAKLQADLRGTLTTGGSATAYTLTLTTTPATLADGLFFWATANITNTGGATTLVVTPAGASAFTSKRIKVYQAGAEGDPTAGSILAGNHYLFQYDSAANSAVGAYILVNPSSGGVVLLSSGTAAAVASVSFALPTGYSLYEVDITNILAATANATLNLRVSQDNGLTYESAATAYKYAYLAVDEAAVTTDSGDTAANAILLTNSLPTATRPSHVRLSVPNHAGVLNPIVIEGASYSNTNAVWSKISGMGVFAASSGAFTNLRLLMSAGNIGSLTYRVYGRRD